MITIHPFDVKQQSLGQFRTRTVPELFKVKNVKPEACGVNVTDKLFTTDDNAFLGSVAFAYSRHQPLVLSPDDVWLCIAQGLAIHINENAEELRHQFVAHEGKAVIAVQRDSFIRGNPDNAWPDVFSEFGEKIKTHIGPKYDLIVGDFSTTGPVERAASEIVLMDAMKNYFEYRMYTLCGFPSITILGTVDDWQNIRTRVATFAEFGLERWSHLLDYVLAEIVNTFGGREDPSFWQDIYNRSGGSGVPTVSGWINMFFPYLYSKREGYYPNPFKDTPTNDFPSGLSSAPFTWFYYEQELPYAFTAGFVGGAITEHGVRPATGWAVVDKE